MTISESLTTPNEWQHIDPETGLLFPWYTKSFLDELATWDLNSKVVCEYGAGASTIWWNKKAKYVFTVENNEPCFEHLIKHIGRESIMMYTARREEYIAWITRHPVLFDLVIVDGDPIEWRDECIKTSIAHIAPGGILIIDNWDQPSVWVPSDETRALLAPYEMKVYKQEGHPDWQTATFKIV